MTATVNDIAARYVAADWHKGGGSPSYQFLSTGRIVPELLDELTEIQSHITESKDIKELDFLIDYVRKHGPRDDAEAWSEMPW